jgi:hypothetical protein
VNRLWVGHPDRSAITAGLLIDNRERAGRTLVVGGFSGNASDNYGGELGVFNSTLGALGGVPVGLGKPPKPVVMGGKRRVAFVRATVRDIGTEFRRLSEGVYTDSRFENCGGPVNGTYQTRVRGCTFTGCGTAVAGPTRSEIGCLLLDNCVFRGNRLNWAVRQRPIVAVDGEIDTYTNGVYMKTPSSFFMSKRHVVVRVVEAGGKPVKGAAVRATCAGEPPVPELDVCHALTGEDGRTPGPNAKGALLLSHLMVRGASGDGGAPEETTYTHTIEAKAGDGIGRIEGVVPGTSWQELAVTVSP